MAPSIGQPDTTSGNPPQYAGGNEELNMSKHSLSYNRVSIFIVGLGLSSLLWPASAGAQEVKTSFKFDFGSGKVEAGYTQVLPEMVYSAERGFGFEPGAAVQAVDRGGSDALKSDFITSEKPFQFSVAVPEGNYQVTVTLGDPAGESKTTVKAEIRRLMVEKAHLDKGKIQTYTFNVNIRTPQIPGGGEVRLKDREKAGEAKAWDNKLTL